MNARSVGREPSEKKESQLTAEGPPLPRFHLSTLLWLMFVFSLLAGFGFAVELLVGTAWLAVGPMVICFIILLQLPIAWLALRGLSRSRDVSSVTEEQDERESGGPGIK